MNYNNYSDPRANQNMQNMSVPFGATIGSSPVAMSYPQQVPIGTPGACNYSQQQVPGMHMQNGSYAPHPSAPSQYNAQPGFYTNPSVQPAATGYQQQIPHHQGHYPHQINSHAVGGYGQQHGHHHGHQHGQLHGQHNMHSNVIYPAYTPLTYKQQKKLDKKARKQQKKNMGSSSSSSSSSDSD